MSAITKERIELFIKNPLDNGLTRGEQMEVARIALASLEAKPIGAFHIAEQQVDGTSDYLKDGEWPIDNGIIEVYAAPPVPVVPGEIADDLMEKLPKSDAWANGFRGGWNACRAVMLQGVEQPQNARQNIPENIPDGNSPATPDDWVMVPKEPTQAMIKAWLSEVANWRGHVAGYKAALAAAPQHEVK
ncbi:hypothetical protein BBB81_001204 [Salmonella enterica subsp. enterica serovar Weltevreden]|nr:hypothetical protein [Salmonella enterica subsp. enterica serovar Weltevreden]